MTHDPVCGKEVDVEQLQRQQSTLPTGAKVVDPKAGTRRYHDGKWYYFCSLDCRRKFMENPEAFVPGEQGQ
ncbi:MAG: YHS domain-containing protein [Chloroflexi bacterium]|nr:YHS domain-containing protein [Chloroflexota bacterium]